MTVKTVFAEAVGKRILWP